MDNSVIENPNDDINVEEIMKKIRDNIQRRKEAGSLLSNPDKPFTPSNNKSISSAEISNLHSLSDITRSPYIISSHRPLIGRLLLHARLLVNEEIKRYVDPLLTKQSGWNRIVSQVLQCEINQITEIESKVTEIESKVTEIESKVTEIESKVTEIESLIQTGNISENIQKKIQGEFSRQMSGILQGAEEELKALSTFQKIINSNQFEKSKDGRIKLNETLNYLSFEDRFRGSRDYIKNQQTLFLDYFLGCSHVLDIGCGRGEFLELMRENGIIARGVDTDKNMVASCRTLDLDVTLQDALTYLENLEDKSLDGIFIDQVVEHLEPPYLIQLLELCAQKMKSGGYIIVETVNPLSFTSFANFYIDISHVKPVHPATLQYLMSNVGFEEINVRFTSIVEEGKKLQEICPYNNEYKHFCIDSEILNKNISKINAILFGAQDYAVIGRKK